MSVEVGWLLTSSLAVLLLEVFAANLVNTPLDSHIQQGELLIEMETALRSLLICGRRVPIDIA